MLKKLKVREKTISLPIFCPDATRGAVKGMTSLELKTTKVAGVIVNTWHLHLNPGEKKLATLGGIGELMNYQGLIISDSGGFQVFSLFQKDPDYGKITDEGLVTYTGKNKQHKNIFTPEKSIQVQFALQSDIMICLDDFTPPSASSRRQEKSVERTVAWAKRCRAEFDRQCQKRNLSEEDRPLLFAVIQGHFDKKLRKKCADELLKIGFDGYGLGGWLFDEQGKLNLDICAYNASLTPDHLPRYALGFGKPEDIKKLYALGYTIFDCVLPTRDARHGRLYTSEGFLYIDKQKHQLDQEPIERDCDCQTCQNYSRAYLHHLCKIKDSAFYRLATVHNLRFYIKLCEKLPLGEG